jgi:serine/threonine protein kinase
MWASGMPELIYLLIPAGCMAVIIVVLAITRTGGIRGRTLVGLTREGWIGWSRVADSRRLRQHIMRERQLLFKRLADSPPKTPAGALSLLRILRSIIPALSLSPTEPGHKDPLAVLKFTVDTLLMNQPNGLDTDEIECVLSAIFMIEPMEPTWSLARRLSLELMISKTGDGDVSSGPPSKDNLVTPDNVSFAWKEMLVPDRLKTLDRISQRGTSSVNLLGHLADESLRLGENEIDRALRHQYGERLVRLCNVQASADKTWLPPREVVKALELHGREMDGQAETLSPSITLLIARYVAQEVWERDSSGAAALETSYIPVLMRLKDYWDDYPELYQATAVLLASEAIRLDQLAPEHAVLIREALGQWPFLRTPGVLLCSKLLTDAQGDADTIAAVLRHKRDPAAKGQAASNALKAGHILPTDVLFEEALFVCLVSDPNAAGVWLRQVAKFLVAEPAVPSQTALLVARRLADLAIARAVSPDETLVFLRVCHNLLDRLENLPRLLEGIGPLLFTLVMDHGDGLVAADPEIRQSLARLWARLSRGRSSRASIPRWLTPELARGAADSAGAPRAWAHYCIEYQGDGCSRLSREEREAALRTCFERGASDRMVIKALASYLAESEAEPSAGAEREYAARVFFTAIAMGETIGAVGLTRLSDSASLGIERQHVIQAWQAGERGGKLLKTFASLSSEDPMMPLPAQEIEMAIAAFESGHSTASVQKRLLRSLRSLPNLTAAQIDLLSRLISEHVDDTVLLASLIRSPDSTLPSRIQIQISLELVRRGQASTSECEVLANAMSNKELPAEIEPFLCLFDDPTRSSPRLRTATAVLRLLPEKELAQPAFAGRIAEWLHVLRQCRLPEYEEAIGNVLLAGFVARMWQADPEFRRAAALLTCRRQEWSTQTEFILREAYKADELDGESLSFLVTQLWKRDPNDPLVLGVVERLVRRDSPPSAYGPILLDLLRTGRTDAARADWLDLAVLRRMAAITEDAPAIIADAVAGHLFQGPRDEQTGHLDLLAHLMRLGVNLPPDTLVKAVMACHGQPQSGSQYPILISLFADSLLRQAEGGDESALLAIETLLQPPTLPRDRVYHRACGQLLRRNRLSPGLMAEHVLWTLRKDQFGELPHDFVERHGEELAAVVPWPAELGKELSDYLYRTRQNDIPSCLIERLRSECPNHAVMSLAAFSKCSATRERDAHYAEEVESRTTAGQQVSLEDLLGAVDFRLAAQTISSGLPDLATALCQQLGEEPVEFTRSMQDRLFHLYRRSVLPAHGEILLIRAAVTSERADILSAVDPTPFMREQTPEIAVEAFQILYRHSYHRQAAVNLLRNAAEVWSDHNFLPQLITIAEDLCRQDKKEEAKLFLDNVIPRVIQGQGDRDSLSRMAKLLAIWKPATFGGEVELLLRMGEAGVLEDSGPMIGRMLFHATSLENRGHRKGPNYARRLREVLSDICTDPSVQRANDLTLLKEYEYHLPATRLIQLFARDPLETKESSHASDPAFDGRAVEMATRSLPEGVEWSLEEIELAVLLARRAGALNAILGRTPTNLDVLVQRIVRAPASSDWAHHCLESLDLFARIVCGYPSHPQSEKWFDSLMDHLRDLQSLSAGHREYEDLLRLRLQDLLTSDRISRHHTARLFDYALDLPQAEPRDLWTRARQLQEVGKEQAERLMLRCLGEGLHNEARTILMMFARCAGRHAFGNQGPGFSLRIEGSLARDRFQAIIKRFLGACTIGDDLEALILSMDVAIQGDQLPEAAHDGFRIAALLRRNQPESAAAVAASDEVRARYSVLVRDLRKQTGQSYLNENSSPERTITYAVAIYLDFSVHPPEQIGKETVDLALQTMRFAHEGGRKDDLQGAARYLGKPDVRAAIELAMSDLLLAMKEKGQSFAANERILLAEVLVDTGRIEEAKDILSQVLAEYLHGSRSSDGNANQIMENAFAIALSILQNALLSSRVESRHLRRNVSEWIETLSTLTERFMRPQIGELSGSLHVVYARLMTWCALTHMVHGAVNKTWNGESSVRVKYWLEAVANDPTVGPHCHAEFLRKALAVRELALEDWGEFLNGLNAIEEFEPLQVWTTTPVGKTSTEEERETIDERYEVKKPLDDQRRAGRPQLLLCRDRRTGHQVVVKRLPLSAGDALPSQVRARIMRESGVLRELKHPGIIRLLEEPHLSTPPYYLVMEYIDGRDLDRWLNDPEKPTWENKQRVFWDLLSVVKALHERQLIHRGLHPKNILVVNETERGSRVIVTDMASVKPFDPAPQAQTRLIDSGLNVRDFIAPELEETGAGGIPHASADIFSLGIILAFLFTGRTRPGKDHWPAGAEKLRFVYETACSHDPRRRYGGYSESQEGFCSGVAMMSDAFRDALESGRAFHIILGGMQRTAGSLRNLRKIATDLRVFRKTVNSTVLLGRIAMEARSTQKQETVIKVVSRDTEYGRDVWQRRDRAVQLQSLLQEIPGAVQMPMAPLEDGAFLCVFSEFVRPGVSLSEVFDYANRRQIPVAEGLMIQWMKEALEILGACHDQDIHHRCLRPSNILVDAKGKIRLSDFLLSHVLSDRTIQKTRRLSQGDQYAAPEWIQSLPSTFKRADLYSLVLSFAVGVTQRRPPKADEVTPALRSVGRVRRMEAFTNVLVAQLHSDPAKRVAKSVKEFLGTLSKLTDDQHFLTEDHVHLVEKVARGTNNPRPLEETDLL